MARLIERLSALEAKRLTRPGMHPDGMGLYLQISPGGAKSWIYRYSLKGRARAMGLGPFHIVPLSEARAMAREARRLRHGGIDPIEHRGGERNQAATTEAQRFTFDDAASAYIEANKAAWRNDKHSAQWSSTLATYVTPKFGDRAVAEIDTNLVLQALQPIWTSKAETAS
jgi:hypothetical protein